VTILAKIKDFLSHANDISLGYNEINFFAPNNLDEQQIGYSIDSNGNSLVTGNEGEWQEEWLVIANDQLGDSIIIDVSSPRLTVLSAAHGEGDWEAFTIADSLENFIVIISILKEFSKGRINPADLEKNPIADKERRRALTKIAERNPKAEMWFWETYFENG
jgi:hypothetical protein